MTEIQHISFVSIPVTDQGRALSFWRDVVGLTVDADTEYMPGQRWIMLRPGDALTKIHLDLVEEVPTSTKPVLPLITTDVAGMVERLRAGDTEIVQEPAEAPWDGTTTFAMFHDSEGNLILLSSK